LDASVNTVHFFADRFHSPHEIFLVKTREATALDNDVAANQNGIDRLTAFTEDELVDDIP
jgi:deoxycytidine triphosphate deaminase